MIVILCGMRTTAYTWLAHYRAPHIMSQIHDGIQTCRLHRRTDHSIHLNSLQEQDGRWVGGQGVHLSPQTHQEHTFRHRSACRKPAESGQEYLTRGDEYIAQAKLSRMKERGGKTGVIVGLDLPSVGGGTEAGVRFPHQGTCQGQRRNI